MYPHTYGYGHHARPESYGYAAPPPYGGAPSPPGAPGAYAYGGYAQSPQAMSHHNAMSGMYGAPVPPRDLSNPAVFESMYRAQLAQLTFNSKPIITNLTLIAQEHVHRMSTIVAKLVDAHIMMAPPPHRLPALYLLDSICKNIGSPYTELWAPRATALFLESYRVVDQPTRRRMEELLATWRDAGPGGRPMLGDATQQTIERSLFGSHAPPVKAQANAQQPPPNAAPNALSASQVIANIERRIALCTKNMASTPGNPVAQEQIDVLRELKEQVGSADVSQKTLHDIQKQLDEMAAAETMQVPPSAASKSASAPVLASAPAAPTAASSASELIANLMKAGLLPSTTSAAAPTGAGAATTGAAVTPLAPAKSQDRAYTDYIMSLDLRMMSLELSRPAPELELFIQDYLPKPCRQCANRYPSGEAGQHSLDDHLDWHFTQNRRARASIARGQSRVWFDSAARWIRSGFDDVVPPSKDDADDPASEHALRDKIANSYVPVPHGSELALKPCPICKELFQSEWSEDLEEWIWRNAVLVEGKYYHASCYYSAKSMSDVVQATRTMPAASMSLPLPQPMVKEEADDLLRKRRASPPDTESPPHKIPKEEHALKSEIV